MKGVAGCLHLERRSTQAPTIPTTCNGDTNLLTPSASKQVLGVTLGLKLEKPSSSCLLATS